MRVLLSDQEKRSARTEIVYRGPLIAPVNEGQEVGFMRLTIDGKVISRVPLITGANVSTSPDMWRKALDSVMFMAFGARSGDAAWDFHHTGRRGGRQEHPPARLAHHLEAHGRRVVLTREPGTPEVKRSGRSWSLAISGATPLSEALLNNAQRLEHLKKVIRPALAAGSVVISDRFMDSTRVYQGVVGGVDARLIAALEDAVVAQTRPDLTLILDACGNRPRPCPRPPG